MVWNFRTKLIAVFSSFVALCLVIATVGWRSFANVKDYYGLLQDFESATMDFNDARTATKSFLLIDRSNKKFMTDKSSQYTVAFDEQTLAMQRLLDELDRSDLLLDTTLKNEVTALKFQLNEYVSNFHTLIDSLYVRGFKDYGAEGELRKAIHAVEKSGYAYDKAYMLMLRRHEKDFFLRKDLKYQDKFDKSLEDFRAYLTVHFAEQPQVQQLLNQHLNNYQANFYRVVALEQVIGFNMHSGLIGNLSKTSNSIGQRFNHLDTLVRKRIADQEYTAVLLFSIVVIAVTVLGVMMAIVFSRSIARPILAFKDGIKVLSDGEFPEALEISGKGEVTEAKKEFNHLVERIKTAANFSEKIGNGELEISYDSSFSNDVLAQSLISMQEKLRDVSQRDQIIQWINGGKAQFSELVNSLKTDDIEEIATHAIRFMVNYVSLNSGIMYRLREEADGNAFMERCSTYAYSATDILESRFALGQSLVGQCWREAESIHLEELPRDYYPIESGLGNASGSNLAVVPIISSEKVVGVFELTGFKKLEEHHFELLESYAAILGGTFEKSMLAEQTRQALHQV